MRASDYEYEVLEAVAKCRDYVNIGFCFRLFETSKEVFEPMTSVDFANFMNLRQTINKVRIKCLQKVKVCYFIYEVAHCGKIMDHTLTKAWCERMIESCSINWDYFDRHCRDPKNPNTSKSNKDFRERLLEAINRP